MVKYHALLKKPIVSSSLGESSFVGVCSQILSSLGASNIQSTGRAMRRITFERKLFLARLRPGARARHLEELKHQLGGYVLTVSPIVKMHLPPQPMAQMGIPLNSAKKERSCCK